MTGRYQAVVLDFDGVLVESVDVKTQAFATLYRPYGADVVERVVDYHLAHGGLTRTEKFRYYHEKLLGMPLSTGMAAELGERFSRLVEDAVVAAPWVPGAMEFLGKYSCLLPLFIASGTPEEELKRIVERRGMSRYFAGVYGAPRTKAEILLHISAKHGFDTPAMLMVGDARGDYEGALQAGTAFVGRAGGNAGFFPPDVGLITDLQGLEALIVRTR